MEKHEADKILQANPQLDVERIAAFEAFQARMERAGVNFQTHYRVQPAFGGLASSLGRRSR